MIEFNVNNSVLVKLTEHGIAELRKRHNRLYGPLLAEKYPFQEPRVDENGYHRIQLWDLMASLGSMCILGTNKMPFETTMFLEEEFAY
jgi:hypothetical protein